jgi:hypothetical protein
METERHFDQDLGQAPREAERSEVPRFSPPAPQQSPEPSRFHKVNSPSDTFAQFDAPVSRRRSPRLSPKYIPLSKWPSPEAPAEGEETLKPLWEAKPAGRAEGGWGAVQQELRDERPFGWGDIRPSSPRPWGYQSPPKFRRRHSDDDEGEVDYKTEPLARRKLDVVKYDRQSHEALMDDQMKGREDIHSLDYKPDKGEKFRYHKRQGDVAKEQDFQNMETREDEVRPTQIRTPPPFLQGVAAEAGWNKAVYDATTTPSFDRVVAGDLHVLSPSSKPEENPDYQQLVAQVREQNVARGWRPAATQQGEGQDVVEQVEHTGFTETEPEASEDEDGFRY